MAYAKTSLRKEKRDLRERMRAMGFDYRHVAVEFARQYRLRPRAAWREAYGLSLTEAAAQFNAHCAESGLDPRGTSGMTAAHLCEYENWPGTGQERNIRRPSTYLLAVLASMYGCDVCELVDLADRENLPTADLLVIDTYTKKDPPERAEQISVPAQSRRKPNLVLRRIREEERHESRAEFATALTKAAREMGESVEPSERYVARLEDGEVAYPHPPYRRVLTRVCGRSMADLGFVPRRGPLAADIAKNGERVGSESTAYGQILGHRLDNMQPSSALMLTESPGLGMAGVVPGDARTARSQIAAEVSASSLVADYPLSTQAMTVDGSLIADDPDSIEMVAGMLPHYAKAANLLGSADFVQLAEKQIRFMYSACEAASGVHRTRILDVCARYAEFLGWLYQDLGNPVYALFWTDRALEWTLETDTNPQFLSYVLMRKSDHAEQFGTPGRVIALAQSALRVPALPPRSRALAIQQEARGYSQCGDEAGFERKLGEARECLLKTSGSDEAPWGLYCDLTHISLQEASGRVDLGQFDRAIEIIKRELPMLSPAARVDAVVFRARLARAYAEAGYFDEAVKAAVKTWRDARDTSSIRALTELISVRHMLRGHENGPLAALFISEVDSLAIEPLTGMRVS